MTCRHLTTLLLATLLAACVSAPSGPPPYDPAGAWEFTATVEGQSIMGTMTIEAAEEGYTGTQLAETLPMPPIPINAVEVVERTVTILADGPDGPLTIALTVTETGMEGTWAMGEEVGAFTASRAN